MLGASLLPGTLMFILGEEGWTDDGGGGTLASRRFPCGQDVDSLICRVGQDTLMLVWLHKEGIQVAGGSGTQVCFGSYIIVYVFVCR